MVFARPQTNDKGMGGQGNRNLRCAETIEDTDNNACREVTRLPTLFSDARLQAEDEGSETSRVAIAHRATGRRNSPVIP